MVARAKWEKFSAIFCNIFTKKKTPENTMSLRTSVATLVWPFPRIPSGHNPFSQRLPLLTKGGAPRSELEY